MAVEVLSGKVFLLITGASQGIGKQIAITFSKLLEKNSKILLLARNKNGLKETAEKISPNVSVVYESTDLSATNADELSEIIKKSAGPLNFERAIIVHNAGSIGDITKFTTDMIDFKYWQEYYNLNVFSPGVLNSVFMKIFNDSVTRKKLVINITSLCGIQPMKSLGYYCSGKAGREMYFKVFAEEYPHINVLNYSPGPVETEMLRILCETAGDKGTKQMMNDAKAQSKHLTPDETVNRLVEILKHQKYKSGAHIDYFDDI